MNTVAFGVYYNEDIPEIFALASEGRAWRYMSGEYYDLIRGTYTLDHIDDVAQHSPIARRLIRKSNNGTAGDSSLTFSVHYSAEMPNIRILVSPSTYYLHLLGGYFELAMKEYTVSKVPNSVVYAAKAHQDELLHEEELRLIGGAV